MRNVTRSVPVRHRPRFTFDRALSVGGGGDKRASADVIKQLTGAGMNEQTLTMIAGLGDVIARCDGVLCDVWGVLHDGVHVFAAAGAALATARNAGVPVVLITNSPRLAPQIAQQLAEIGVSRAAWDAIVTSGDATRALFGSYAPGPALKIGPHAEEGPIFDDLGLRFTKDIGAASFIALTDLDYRVGERPDDYHAILRQALARDLPLVCGNPDIQVRIGDQLYWCAGALARDYAQWGGRVQMAGKPFAPIYDLALAKLAAIKGRELARSRVLAIGDGPATDIAGANQNGLMSLYCLSGISEQAKGASVDHGAVAASLAAYGARADFVLPHLRW